MNGVHWPGLHIGLITFKIKEITFLELVPIVLGIHIWAEQLKSKKLLLHIDNLALVHVINKKSSKSKNVMVLLRALVLHTLRFNIQTVWIIGSSIVHWAQQYAENTNQLDLGLKQFAIIWKGKRGMVWENLSSVVARMSKSHIPPSILILHCGGNNIGDPQNTLKGIQKFMKRTLAQLGQDLPNTLIVWSHILPRGNWRKSLSNFEGEKAKKRINSAIATFVLNQLHGASIKYPDIQVSYKRLFRIDRVHLSDLGNSVLINTWKNAIVQFVTTSTRTYP
ncbi:uncharacterized protein LOC125680186 [Ostrea edulis]|uniref:uncharacterized protein LOC125680186 n=1 Tax=Ostrea edulis TaxID=37623 RepID=UPI0024AF794A|nr:uncharacterized protein LOC125680186 [Ostrea edulis]